MSLKAKLALGIIVVFCAGVATGLFAAAWHAHHLFLARSGHMNHRMREHLERELHLTADQEQKIAPILDQLETKLDAIRSETGRRVSEVMNQSHQEIAPFLNAEQRAHLDEMAKRHRHMLHPGQEPPPPPP